MEGAVSEMYEDRRFEKVANDGWCCGSSSYVLYQEEEAEHL